MTRQLTPKQKRVLDFIRDYSEAFGYPPTQQEIARKFQLRSLGSVQNYLVRLERLGLLRRSWNAKRALEVVETEAQGFALPLCGYVAAGQPIEAVESPDTLEVPPGMVQGDDNFVLRVKGDSMVNDGILDGDYVVVRRQETARAGQTVVALIDGEATVKRYHPRAGGVELHPANDAMEPIVVPPESRFEINGVVVGVLRFLR